MSEIAIPIPEITPALAATPLPCPRCGYDLRGTSADICSECGQTIDRAVLSASGFPWAHRRKVGRARGFLSTVWLVSWDSLRLRQEVSRPQDLSDAWRFRAILIVLLTLSGVGALATFVADAGGLQNLLIQPQRAGDNGFRPWVPPAIPGWQQDLAIPWCAGVSIQWLVPLCVLLLAIYLTGIARSAMRLGSTDPQRRRQLSAIGIYAAAPLVWMAIAALLYFGVHELNAYAVTHPASFRDSAFQRVSRIAADAPAAVAGFVLLLFLRRCGQWVTRAHFTGVGRGVLAILECFGRTLLGVMVCCGVIPWCCGLTRVMAHDLF